MNPRRGGVGGGGIYRVMGIQVLWVYSGKYSLSSFFLICIMLKAGSILELCSIELTLSHSILKKKQFS